MKKRLLPIFAVLLLLIALLTTVGCDKKSAHRKDSGYFFARLEYLKGQTFDLNNAKLTVYYADSTSKTIPLTYEMISEYNPKAGGHILWSDTKTLPPT